VLQTSVYIATDLLLLLLLMTMMQVSVTSLLLILGIFCSAELARGESLYSTTVVNIFTVVILTTSVAAYCTHYLLCGAATRLFPTYFREDLLNLNWIVVATVFSTGI